MWSKRQETRSNVEVGYRSIILSFTLQATTSMFVCCANCIVTIIKGSVDNAKYISVARLVPENRKQTALAVDNASLTQHQVDI